MRALKSFNLKLKPQYSPNKNILCTDAHLVFVACQFSRYLKYADHVRTPMYETSEFSHHRNNQLVYSIW